ncbi:kelch-like protein 10 isoform X1 [Hippocampus comes]|uniref:kelch-like protein 10 isoform X1 n=1 Tax=Hippocampus comes TaxID=109280 RepID=UPI00094E0ADA|nr:PREDICTED: kelch-like protein 10 isoform X1 [Hippocampus comes]
MSYDGKYSYRSVNDELSRTRKLSDAVIRVDNAEFHIHKIILCKCSHYFRALFLRWSTSDQRVYVIHGLTAQLMQLFVDFAYAGSVLVTKDNVKDLLLAADRFNIIGIVQTCCAFLTEQLCPENCIGIWQFTRNCYTPDLQRNAFQYILYHFEDVASSNELQQLSVQDLCDILDRDDLMVKTENTVYEAILHWIAHAPWERGDNMAVLLAKVRLALTSVEFIAIKVLTNHLIQDSRKCLDIVALATRVMCHMNTNSVCGYRNLVARPRLPSAILLAIGGFSGPNPTHLIEAYDVHANTWADLVDNMEHPHAYFGTAFLGNSVYCVGGFDGRRHYNTVRRFDVNTRTWHQVAPMHFRRCSVSVTVLNGRVYAIGGVDGRIRLKNAEYYMPETNQWTLIASMHEHRSDASCTTLNNKVYVCGGFNGNEPLRTAEYYNPETNQWTMIVPMNCCRSGTGVIAYANHIYAIGGFDGDMRLCSVEAYDPNTDAWMLLPSMQCPRSNFGIQVLEDRLFVAGGNTGVSATNMVEYYDAHAATWFPACDMAVSRSALSCCVVSGLANVGHFVTLRSELPWLQLEEVALEMEDDF